MQFVTVKHTLWVTAEEYKELAGIDCVTARRERMQEIAGRPLGKGLVRARQSPRTILQRVVVEAQA